MFHQRNNDFVMTVKNCTVIDYSERAPRIVRI